MATQNSQVKGAAPTATVSAAVFYGATGISGTVTFNQLANWLKGSVVQGNQQHVQVVPLANVALGQNPPLPFGYGGKPTGVRASIQNWLLYGICPTSLATGTLWPKHGGQAAKGKVPVRGLQQVLALASKHGHSATNPNCLLAMLNGGYTRSSNSWGTPFAKLVYKPTS